MSKRFQAVRGMNDILPADAPAWQALTQALHDLARQYGYEEISFPVLESTALFKRSVGDTTDIVEKEMYTFADRNGDSLSLRPEGTAGCLRAGIEHGLFHNQQQRLWYMGPMFRHERPQKGRYRQFNQFGLEAVGMSGPDIDAEIILFMARLWKKIGLDNTVTLQLNSLGSSASRAAYRGVLQDYFRTHFEALDDDSKRRLETNPLRILDSKNPALAALIADAPQLTDHLDDTSRAHFEGLCQRLDDAGLAYTLNPRLVRGLDYYGLTVFEWVTDALGAQGTLCAGGRYDGLIELLGGRSTPAVGFAMGLERIVELMQLNQHAFPPPVDIYILSLGEAPRAYALQLAERLRDALPHRAIELHCGETSIKSQFKRADRRGAEWAIVIGDDELADNTVTIKALRTDAEQQRLSEDALIQQLQTEREPHGSPQ